MTPTGEHKKYGAVHSRHRVKILMLRHLCENPNGERLDLEFRPMSAASNERCDVQQLVTRIHGASVGGHGRVLYALGPYSASPVVVQYKRVFTFMTASAFSDVDGNFS